MAKQRIVVFACQSQQEQLIIGKIRPKKAKSCHGISAGSVNKTALYRSCTAFKDVTETLTMVES